MGKTWASFFAINMIAMAALCFAAPAMGLWMPDGVSTHSASVDFLFYVILWITAFFFFLTEAILVIFLWKYGCGCKEVATGVPAFLKPIGGLIDTPHKVEMAWTIVPAAILLYIAFAQVGTWARVKYQSRMDELIGKDRIPVRIEVSARQFEWRMRYPSAKRYRDWLKNPQAEKDDMESFSKNPHADDVHVVNELHAFGETAPVQGRDEFQGNPVLVHLSTRDVLHSFNLPQFRVKQDAVPGRVIPVWFTPTKVNTVKLKSGSGQVWLDGMGRTDKGEPVDKLLIWDIACAELCGWGHWRMIGRVYVHPTQEDFLEWLEQAGKGEHSRTK